MFHLIDFSVAVQDEKEDQFFKVMEEKYTVYRFVMTAMKCIQNKMMMTDTHINEE